MSGTRCTVERRNGQFCDAASAPDLPFPICGRHAIELYRRMREIVGDAARDIVHAQYAKTWGLDQIQRDQHRRRNTPEHRVYYVRVGDLVKIGTTGNLDSRLGAYPPGSELLASEPGGHDIEAERLAQFAHLKAQRREWFHPGAALIAHIEHLRSTA